MVGSAGQAILPPYNNISKEARSAVETGRAVVNYILLYDSAFDILMGGTRKMPCATSRRSGGRFPCYDV